MLALSACDNGSPATTTTLPPTFAVTFDTHDGEPVPSVQNVAQGGFASRPSEDPTKYGYNFLDWYTTDGSTDGAVFAFATTPITAATTIHARWTNQPVFTVTFDTHSGTPVPLSQNVALGGFAARPHTDPTKDGYNFVDWYTTAGPTDGAVFAFAMTPIAVATTIHARWTDQAVHTVTFDTHNGTPVPLSQNVVQGGFATRPLMRPERDGYIFVDWYTTAGPSDGVVFAFTTTPITAATTIHARWIAVHTVTFNTHNGTPVPQDQNVVHGELAVRPSEDPTKDGYRFVNWYTTAGPTDGEVFAFTTTPITATTTIHARWIEFTSIIETVFVQGDSFMFGRCAQTNPNDGTLETVGNFHIGKFPVTQGQWFEVMGNRPSFFTGTNNYANNTVTPTFNRDNLPVEQVSWYDVLVFANKLSERDGLRPAYSINGSTNPAQWGNVPTSSNAAWDNVVIVEGANGWRLPTEFEWEFAAKGGRQSAGFTGTDSDTYFIFSGSDDADEVAWYWGNSGGRTHPVGEKESNELGLYDMSGNVWEWTQTQSGADRVIRGGSWNSLAASTSSVIRLGGNPTFRINPLGFRLVRP